MSKWISVKKRLPEDGVDVLIWMPGEEDAVIGWHYGGEWCRNSDEWGYLKYGPVAFWHPLPDWPDGSRSKHERPQPVIYQPPNDPCNYCTVMARDGNADALGWGSTHDNGCPNA